MPTTWARERGGLGALGTAGDARDVLERAIEIDPTGGNGSAYVTLGALYDRAPGRPLGFGNSDTAERMFQRALELSMPGEFTAELALMRLSNLYQLQGYYEHALEFIDRAIELRADESRYHLIRADLLLSQEEYELALSAIYEAMKDTRVQHAALVLAQQVAQAQGDHDAVHNLGTLIQKTAP